MTYIKGNADSHHIWTYMMLLICTKPFNTITMKLFRLDFASLLVRYYLLMAVVLIAGFTGMWWLAFLGLPIVLSCLAGCVFNGRSQKASHTGHATITRHDGSVQTAA